ENTYFCSINYDWIMKTKLRISFVLFLLGVVLTAVRGYELAMASSSGKAWFHFIAIAYLTLLAFDGFYQRYKKMKHPSNLLSSSCSSDSR
ncbi:MAG: hypothetical protein K2J74_03795, partial [Muribaculaceae bacterium]|nr:hypothetical protein [Muribaculaceae bacterium]